MLFTFLLQPLCEPNNPNLPCPDPADTDEEVEEYALVIFFPKSFNKTQQCMLFVYCRATVIGLTLSLLLGIKWLSMAMLGTSCQFPKNYFRIFSLQ